MSDNTVERRAVRRHKVLKGATVSFDDSGVACVVRNLSTSGATLELASSISLPSSFTLEIKAVRFSRRGRGVGSREKRIGVVFSLFRSQRGGGGFFDVAAIPAPATTAPVPRRNRLRHDMSGPESVSYFGGLAGSAGRATPQGSYFFFRSGILSSAAL